MNATHKPKLRKKRRHDGVLGDVRNSKDCTKRGLNKKHESRKKDQKGKTRKGTAQQPWGPVRNQYSDHGRGDKKRTHKRVMGAEGNAEAKNREQGTIERTRGRMTNTAYKRAKAALKCREGRKVETRIMGPRGKNRRNCTTTRASGNTEVVRIKPAYEKANPKGKN